MIKSEFTDFKIWIGYIIGLFIVLQNSFYFIMYSYEESEPVNVLENYLVATNNPNTVIFLSLGIFLIYSNSPYMKGNAQYFIYRTGKRRWKESIFCYILLQAVFYNILLFLLSVISISPNGYWGNIWSVPLCKVTEGGTSGYGLQVNFLYRPFMECVSPYTAVFLTLFLFILYHYLLGLIIYVFSLCANGYWGILAGLGIHFLGFLIMSEGYYFLIDFSLLGRSLPVLQIGEGTQTSILGSVTVFVSLIIFMQTVLSKVIKVVDLDINKREGDFNE